MKKADDVAFLNKLVETEYRQSTTTRPFSVVLGGVPYVYATDGCHIVAVETGELLPEFSTGGPNIAAVVMPILLGDAIPLAALKAFAGDPAWPDLYAASKEVPCSDCKGKGVIDGYCHSCGREEDEDCSSCDGSGKAEEDVPHWPKPRRGGWIGDALFDLTRLARCLAYFDDETVRVTTRGCTHGAYFVGAGWFAMVMPMRPEAKDEERPRFEALTAQTA